MAEQKDDLAILTIPQDTYAQLQGIAKKENKAVVDVVSDAFRKHIDEKSSVQESTQQRKLLMEG